ncbi:MAG: hypothetical protein IJ443_09160 [Firmicutes bacterium]|nr:hypothetical protein [Bacillota bacterium]
MKKLLSILLVCLLCTAMTGCSTTYEDTNGPDDYTLQTITDENIINLDIGASGLVHKETTLFGFTSEEYYSDNFNGVEPLHLTNFILPSDIQIYVSYVTVNSGNFRMVVVNEDKIIHEFVPGTFNETIRFENLKGSFAIHVAGESADFEMFFDTY